jgi:cytochrome c553
LRERKSAPAVAHETPACEFIAQKEASEMGRRFGLHSACVAAAAAVAAGAPHAQDAAPPGRLLASNCFQCHGTNGRGPGFERLAGKSAEKLYREMKELQSGDERDSLMGRHALGYSDAQLRELTQWLASQPR